MKIAVLTKTISQRSGARAPIKLAEAFAAQGHKVDLYAHDEILDKNLLERLKRHKIKVFLFHFPKIRFLGNWLVAWKLFKALKKTDYDVYSTHVHTPLLIAAKLAGGLVIKTYYGTQLSTHTIYKQAGLKTRTTIIEKIRSFLWDRIVVFDQRVGLFFVDRSVAISKYLQNEADNLYHQKNEVIYLGAETEWFNSIVKTSPQTAKPVTILSVSRLVPYKGFDRLIKIVNKLSVEYPHLRLQIIGAAVDQDYYHHLQTLLTPNSKIILNPSDQELVNYYQNCDIYATYDLWVPWSLTPLEASFFGKPLLGLKRGAMSEIIVNGDNGFIAENAREYSVYLERLVLDKKLREKLGKRAKGRVEKEFSWEKCASEYVKYFLKVDPNRLNPG